MTTTPRIDIRAPENLRPGFHHQVVGLTGNPGSGKSTISQWLQEWGAKVLDADRLGHRMLQNDSPVHDTLVHTFGHEILNQDGYIDRKKLGAIVFQSQEALQRLNRIVHPPMLEQIKQEINQYRNQPNARFFVVDAALLFEWEIQGWFDAIITVAAPVDLRRERVFQKYREDVFKKREAAQLPEIDKVNGADVIIQNSGTLEQLRPKLQEFMES